MNSTQPRKGGVGGTNIYIRDGVIPRKSYFPHHEGNVFYNFIGLELVANGLVCVLGLIAHAS